MLKPEEIKVPEFDKGFKGYNTQAVDSCIQQLLAQYKELYDRYTETEQKLNAVVEKYKETSARTTEAMNEVKKVSVTIVADARKEAEKITSDAASEAEKVTSEARAEAERTVAEANAKAEKINAVMKESCQDTILAYELAFEEEKKKFLEIERESRIFKENLLEAYKTHVTDINNKFPTLSAEEISKVSFQSEVSVKFKEKLT